MNRTEAIFLLTRIEEEFRAEHLDTEADAIALAIYTMGTVDELRKERDAAMAERTEMSILQAVKTIEDFLASCKDVTTSVIVALDGTEMITDWGYFEEGLEEIKRYAERRTDE